MPYTPITKPEAGTAPSGSYKPIGSTPAYKPISLGAFNLLTTPRTSSVTPISSGLSLPSTQDDRLKAIDKNAKLDLGIQPRAGAELRAPTTFEKVKATTQNAIPPLAMSILQGLAKSALSVGETPVRVVDKDPVIKPRVIPGLSLLGPLESHWNATARRVKDGEDPKVAALKEAGTFLLDEPFGVAFKGAGIVLGPILKKTLGNSADDILRILAKTKNEDEVMTILKQNNFSDDFARIVAPDVAKATTPEAVLRVVDDAFDTTLKVADEAKAVEVKRGTTEQPVRAVDDVQPARSVVDDVRLADTESTVYRGEGANTGMKNISEFGGAKYASASQDYAKSFGEVVEYTVPKTARLINAEAPISQEVRDVLLAVSDAKVVESVLSKNPQATFREVWKQVTNMGRDADTVNASLRSAGYDGIEYNVGKQIAGKPVKNFAVFNDDVLVPRLAGNKVDEIIETSEQTLERYAREASVYKNAPSPEFVPARSTEGFGRLVSNMLEPISTKLERINPELKKALRRFEAEVMLRTSKSAAIIKPLLSQSAKMTPVDRTVWDLAQKNSDVKVQDLLSQKYGFEKELKDVRALLDDIHTRATESGMDIGYRKGYFPRITKDPIQLLRYLQGDPNWSMYDAYLQRVAKEKGKHLNDITPEEQVGILNNMLRGYGNKITLSSPAFAKGRTIDFIDSDLNKFYVDSDTALATYITRMEDEIAGRNFFGKGENIMDSIGAYVMREIQSGKLNPADADEVSDVLRARFARGKMAGALSAYRDLEYMSTMGSPISAITQLQDLSFSAYENGVYNTLAGATKAAGKKGVTKEQLGVEKITQEFMEQSVTGKYVDATFKLVGLSQLDRLGKETLVNSTFLRLQDLANKGDIRLKDELFRILNADEIPLATQELKNGELTDRTAAVLINKLLDFQPVTKSEMPLYYLKHPNGRIMYMLKSFTIKQIDVFRRESLSKIASGDPKQVAIGIGNFIHLSSLFMLAGMGADKLKDAVLGRETDISDTVVDNIYRIFGATKYDIYKARTEGFGSTVLRKMLFPMSIIDRAGKDITNIFTDKEYTTGPLKGENYKLESTQSIPLGGKLYYWWLGRGAQKQEYSGETTEEPKVNDSMKLDMGLDLNLDLKI